MSDPTVDEQRAEYEDEAIVNPPPMTWDQRRRHAEQVEDLIDQRAYQTYLDQKTAEMAVPSSEHEYECVGCGAVLFGTGAVEMCNRCDKAW